MGTRLRMLREQRDRTQSEVAAALGMEHRQTVGAIEAGQRAMSAEEMAAASDFFGVPIDHFTDPFHAEGEVVFSFRAEKADKGTLANFEQAAGRWLATYRELAKPTPVRHEVTMRVNDTYERAQAVGESIRRRLRLGSVPARDLAVAVERDWDVLVLLADIPKAISGAASRIQDVDAVILNRAEAAGRRNYNLAHEIFHLLTWDSLPPPRVLGARGDRGAVRTEELANNFAAALLMPEDAVRVQWPEVPGEAIAARIALLADRFEVSAPAMKWRLVNLGLVNKKDVPSDADLASAMPHGPGSDVPPPPFNNRLVHHMHQAVEVGDLSLRKAAAILGTTSLGLAEVFRAHGRALSYEV